MLIFSLVLGLIICFAITIILAVIANDGAKTFVATTLTMSLGLLFFAGGIYGLANEHGRDQPSELMDVTILKVYRDAGEKIYLVEDSWSNVFKVKLAIRAVDMESADQSRGDVKNEEIEEK